jgi:hypothetical protein
MIHTPRKDKRIPLKIIKFLTLFIVVSCVLVAGCSMPTIKNTNAKNSSSPTITPTITSPTSAVVQTTVPVRTENATEVKKGLLNVTIGDYPAELPVFVDNKSAGVVSVSKPLNLTANVGGIVSGSVWSLPVIIRMLW